jgi:hypothetical protein
MHRTWIAAFTLLACGFAFVACNKQASQVGEKKLTLNKPANQSIRQGDTNKVSVSIDRDKFKDEVRLTVSGLPVGVTMNDGTTAAILPQNDKVDLVLVAASDAPAVNDHPTTVTATSGNLPPVSQTFFITVKPKTAN